ATAASTASAPTAEAEPEAAEEVVDEVLEVAAEACAARGPSALESLMAVAVVDLPLLDVDEDLVCLGDFLEPPLPFRVARVAVGMVLHGELAIRLLDVVVGRRFDDTEDFVVIALGHGWRTRGHETN